MATTLRVGESKVFITRPIGMTTILFVRSTEGGFTRVFDFVQWHIELCCQNWRDVPLFGLAQRRIDISSARGALVTVKNPIGMSQSILVWTDYV